MMVDFKIRNIEFNYDTEGVVKDVTVRFDYNDQVDFTSINGSVKISKVEYEENSANFTGLETIVKTKFKDKVSTI